MTIKSALELSRDLDVNAEWPLFSSRVTARQRAAAVAACTLTWSKSGASSSEVMKQAHAGLKRSLIQLAGSLGYVTQIFVVHATLQYKSAVVMHRRLWRVEALRSMPPGIARGAEAKIEDHNGVRFAGLASVPSSELSWVVANLEAFQSVVPLLTRAGLPTDEEAALRLASAALPAPECRDPFDLNWPSLAHYVVSRGGICLRWTRDLSIPELAADLFVADAQAEKVARILKPLR